jgi:hypothetical protein
MSERSPRLATIPIALVTMTYLLGYDTSLIADVDWNCNNQDMCQSKIAVFRSLLGPFPLNSSVLQKGQLNFKKNGKTETIESFKVDKEDVLKKTSD